MNDNGGRGSVDEVTGTGGRLMKELDDKREAASSRRDTEFPT